MILSVLQNIRVILETAKGSVPLYRDFGTDYSFLDAPQNVVKPMIHVAVKDAIERYEPRARFVDISGWKASEDGRLWPIVEVEIIVPE